MGQKATSDRGKTATFGLPNIAIALFYGVFRISLLKNTKKMRDFTSFSHGSETQY
jgi:hypothetical protein